MFAVLVVNHDCFVCHQAAKYMARNGRFLCTIHAVQAIKAGEVVCNNTL